MAPNFPNHAVKATTGWYDSSNVKSSKMSSFDSVAEAHGLTYPRPSGEYFSFAYIETFLVRITTLCGEDKAHLGGRQQLCTRETIKSASVESNYCTSKELLFSENFYPRFH